MSVADTDHTIPSSRRSGLGTRILNWLAAIGEASAHGRRAREVAQLLRLSDAELARRGLTRDRVVPHVFGPYLHL